MAAVRADCNGWVALYIGRTDDFGLALQEHVALNEAVRRGATHVHLRVEPNPTVRQALEEVLIRLHRPPLNESMQKGCADFGEGK